MWPNFLAACRPTQGRSSRTANCSTLVTVASGMPTSQRKSAIERQKTRAV